METQKLNLNILSFNLNNVLMDNFQNAINNTNLNIKKAT